MITAFTPAASACLLSVFLALSAPQVRAQDSDHSDQKEQSPKAVAELKVLQSIEPGLWQSITRFEPAAGKANAPSTASTPETGCVSPQGMAEDLQALLSKDDGFSCKGELISNDEHLGVIQISCPVVKKSSQAAGGKIFNIPPAAIEIRSFSAEHFTVTTRIKKTGTQAASAMIQTYERQGECPQ